jgi:ActR/RegA family two-component response regulator
MADCPYEFQVEVAESAAACVEKIREREQLTDQPPYDVIVLDVRMEGERSGLDTAFVLALYEELGVEKPVQIVITGYPSYSDCVEAMRYGAWDYIVKEDVGETPMAQVVVNSAVRRLRQLDLRREQESRLAASWIPAHLLELQAEHAGQLVALWHKPVGSVIASGRDAFELKDGLKDWHREHEDWERPFVIQVPPPRGDRQEEG